MNKIRILLADDHTMFREALRGLLNVQPDMQVVGEAYDGKEATRQAERMHPDIILMDIRMRELDGVSAARYIRDRSPTSKVIMLTMGNSLEEEETSFEAGAWAFITKEYPSDVLLNVIRRVFMEQQPSHISRRWLDPAPETLSMLAHTAPMDITPRDIKVLGFLSLGMRNRNIGFRMGLKEQSVKNYLSKLFERMKVQNRSEAVARAIALGVIPPLDED